MYMNTYILKEKKHCSLFTHGYLQGILKYLVSDLLSIALLVGIFPFRLIETGYRKQVHRREKVLREGKPTESKR